MKALCFKLQTIQEHLQIFLSNQAREGVRRYRESVHISLVCHPYITVCPPIPPSQDLLNGKQITKHHPKNLKPFHPETPLFGHKSYSQFSSQQRGIITIRSIIYHLAELKENQYTIFNEDTVPNETGSGFTGLCCLEWLLLLFPPFFKSSASLYRRIQ